MTKLNAGKASVLALATTFGLSSLLLANAMTTNIYATPAPMITICHAAGQDDTTQYITLTLSTNAVYQDQGEGGHFYENGTPKAGHENDYLGPCTNPTATPSPTPTATASPTASPTATATATPSSTPEPTATPSSTPEATATPEATQTPQETATPVATATPNGDVCLNLEGIQTSLPDSYHFDNDGKNCLQYEFGGPSDPKNPEVLGIGGGQVLGASTMAGTGSFAENLYLAIMTLGGTLTAKAASKIRKAFKKAN